EAPRISEAIPEAGPKEFTIKTIIIDPGHGGKDPGAISGRFRIKEKGLTLAISKKLKNILERHGIKVIMTRDDDTFIPLPKRSAIANKSGADLFVSVHINASRTRSMRGFECYYLSEATDDNARAIEAFENSSLKLSDNAMAEHSTKLDKALWDMMLTENRRESAELAGRICGSVEKSMITRNRGIRTARFYVLKRTRIPSVLVEVGYISNRIEEMKFKEPGYLDRVAEALAKGILTNKSEYEKTEGFTRQRATRGP
ncbi:MAG: N-acetylmuramoyl-L-alanine amidase, partial [Candidatus Omnitrophota bacterium]|nr:N-acetylmuramoyl-L-alanine amidase [Candidatus Omnitrophota bacterium]